MARIGLTLAIAVIAIALAASFQEAYALKCWECDNVTQKSCGYPFEAKNISKSSLVECKGSDPVCLKVVAQMYITRKCVNIKANYAQLCSFRGVPGSFCEHCNSDECNSASEYGPAVAVIAIPIAILKIFSLF